MKLFVKVCIIFAAFAFIDSASLGPQKYESGNGCKTVEIESDYYNPDGDEARIKKSNEQSPCEGNDPSECTEETEDAPVLASSQQPEMEILENIPMAPSNYFYELQPSQRAFDWTPPYHFNNVPGFRGIPYSGVQYYVQPSLYTPFKPSPAYLPPTIPAYARRLIPELHGQLYRRPARVIRSRAEDDFLSELRHMAIMNNILPTMSIPFMRSYNDNAPYGIPSVGGATALFPASASGCAVPLLFSCSPKITQGIVAQPLPSDYSYLVHPAAPLEYQKQESNKEDIAELNSGISQSDLILHDSLKISDDNHYGNKKEPAMNAIDRALQPKHVVGEKHAVSEKSHVEGVHPVMTSKGL